MFKQLSINVWIYVPTNVLQSSLSGNTEVSSQSKLFTKSKIFR